MQTDPNIMQAVEQLGYRVTVGDVATKAGLNINLAEKGLLTLASEAGGHLQVAETGDVVYQFPQNFRDILRNKYIQLQIQEWWQKIEGLNLEEWLEKQGNKGINQELAIKWLKQLAEILQLVHEKQFFHRDIKPGNIMIRSDGGLVLIDFGTAREATYTYLAKVGMGAGVTGVVSAGYTPPEQQNGHALPQSDFFALGRTFVHLLTGRHPLDFYDANNDVLRWRGHVSGVSSLLLDFIDELMALKPNQRPLNTQVVLQRIGELDSRIIKKEIKPDFIPVVQPQLSQEKSVVQPQLSQEKSIVSQIFFSLISYFGWRFAVFYAIGILLFIVGESYKLLQPNDSVSYQTNNASVSQQTNNGSVFYEKTNRVDFSNKNIKGHSSIVKSFLSNGISLKEAANRSSSEPPKK